MSGFFSLDGPFQKYGSILADIIILSLLWIVVSIPFFTLGASTTALFYITTKKANKRDVYLLRPFFKSFKDNFIQSTLTFILFLVIYLLLIFNIRLFTNGVIDTGNTYFNTILLMAQFAILLEVFITNLYVYPVISRFELKTIQAIKTSFVLANKHLLSTFYVIFIIIFIGFLIIQIHPLFMLVAIGLYAFTSSYVFVNVFKKYIPDMDAYEDEPTRVNFQNDSATRIINSANYIPPGGSESTVDASTEEKQETQPVNNTIEGTDSYEPIKVDTTEKKETEKPKEDDDRIDPRFL